MQQQGSINSIDSDKFRRVGARCNYPMCRQLDFLPFTCPSCTGSFCQEHKHEWQHECTKAGEANRIKLRENRGSGCESMSSTPPTIFNHEHQCSHPACKKLIDTPLTPGVQCDSCNRRFCIGHRMIEQHDCHPVNVSAQSPSISESISNLVAKSRGVAALEKFRNWALTNKNSASNSTITSSRRKNSSLVSRNQLIAQIRKSAQGDASIPSEQRIYLVVEVNEELLAAQKTLSETSAKAQSVVKSRHFFYAKSWSVGKLLDIACRAVQIENLNNTIDNHDMRKLCVFHVESGRILEFSEKIGVACKTGDTIVLMRGVRRAAVP